MYKLITGKLITGLSGVAAAVLTLSAANAQGTVKIGLINVLSGQFADAGIQLDNGVKTYMIRASVTLPQIMETFGTWAAKSGIKKCYTMVTDYGPGHDSEAAFTRAFKEAGGEIIGSVRFPVANPDFSAFVQRAKDMNPECIYVFIPGGAQPAALGKALAERGVDPSKIKILASGEATAEQALKSMGDAGL